MCHTCDININARYVTLVIFLKNEDMSLSHYFATSTSKELESDINILIYIYIYKRKLKQLKTDIYI